MSPGEYGVRLRTWRFAFESLMSGFAGEGKLNSYVTESAESVLGTIVTRGRNKLTGFKNLDEYDLDSVLALMENGLDLLEDGRRDGQSFIYHTQKAMEVANNIGELSKVFDIITYDDDESSDTNIMNVNMPLLLRYHNVMGSMTEPVQPQQPEVRYAPLPASGTETQVVIAQASSATDIIEQLKSELVSGVPTEQVNAITAELLERLGKENLDQVLELVQMGRLKREADRFDYEIQLSNWLDVNIDTIGSEEDLDRYSELMEQGARFPEVVQRYGNKIRKVQGMVSDNCLHAPLNAMSGEVGDQYLRATEAMVMINGILDDAPSTADDRTPETVNG